MHASKNKVISMLLLTIFIMSCTPMFIVNGLTSTDSSVFEYVGMEMGNGFVPYKHTFDHKGPFIYLINFLGMEIAGWRGVAIFEFIFNFAGLAFIYKICRLKQDRLISLLITALCAFIYGKKFFEGGNLTEEYAMPFIAMSVYIFLNYFIKENMADVKWCLLGVGFGAICMLRPNMIGVWAAGIPFAIYEICAHKNIIVLLKSAVLFLFGALIFVSPFMIWLYLNDALDDFWNIYIIFNMHYSSAGAMGEFTYALKQRFHAFMYFARKWSLEIALLDLFMAKKFHCKIDKANIASLLMLFVSLLLVSMSGRRYGHYAVVLVPLFAYPLSEIVSMACAHYTALRMKIEKYKHVLIACAVIMSLVPVGKLAYKGFYDDSARANALYETVAYICDNTNPDDRISVWGNQNCIYVRSNRLSASKYSYQIPIGDVDSRIINEYLNDLGKSNPKIIVTTAKQNDKIKHFLIDNGYNIKKSIQSVYYGEHGIDIYKK